MTDLKYCKMCGTLISNANDDSTDYFRHIALKYCPACRKLSDQQKTALRVYNLRQRKKQKDKFRDEQLILLNQQVEMMKEENELLRQKIMQLREDIIDN